MSAKIWHPFQMSVRRWAETVTVCYAVVATLPFNQAVLGFKTVS